MSMYSIPFRDETNFIDLIEITQPSQLVTASINHLQNLENDIYFALEKSQLVLFYQPIVHTKSGELVGMEALLYWDHPVYGMLPPSEFLNIVAGEVIMEEIGDWLLYSACLQIKKWNRGLTDPIKLHLDLSYFQFSDSYFFCKSVEMVLKELKLNSQCLCLELSEQVALQSLIETYLLINDLKDLGIEVAINNVTLSNKSLDDLLSLGVHLMKVAPRIEKEKEFLLTYLGCEIIENYYSNPQPANKIEEHLTFTSNKQFLTRFKNLGSYLLQLF